MGMTGEVMGSGIDRKGREGGMKMEFGVTELVGMFEVTVLDITFESSLLITGLGVGLIELEMTIGVGITGMGRGPVGSSSSMIEYIGLSGGGSLSSALELQTSMTGSAHGRRFMKMQRAL